MLVTMFLLGTKTTICYDVAGGSNMIMGAGSLMNKDRPKNFVVVREID